MSHVSTNFSSHQSISSEQVTDTVSRRKLLKGAVTGGALVASSMVLGSASAQASSPSTNGTNAVPAALRQPSNLTHGAGSNLNTLSARSGITVTDLEIVTVTPTSVTLCWSTFEETHTTYGPFAPTVPTDEEVRLAPITHSGPLPIVHRDRTPRGYHLVTVGNLTPGTEYRFECRSAGKRAEPGLVQTALLDDTTRTGTFTTLTPPPGRLITTLAIMNDTHIGETENGILVGNFPTPITQLPGRRPYPEVMLSSALQEIRHRGVRHVFVNGDTTSEARPAEVDSFRKIMNDFGRFGKDWFVTRGNHDRPHTPDADPDAHYEKFPVLPGTRDHRDPWGAAFIPRQRMWETQIRGIRIIGLDTAALDKSGGEISDRQMAQLRRTLRRNPQQPTLLMAHHPVTRESGRTNMGGPNFILNRADSDELQYLLAETPGAFMMVAGHTHRAKRVAPDAAKNVDFVELSTAKEYPAGYTLLHIYSGGYMLNFHRTATPGALEWASRSRWSYYGMNPEYMLGSTADRNYVQRRNFG